MLSIVVCTANRSKQLQQCLSHIVNSENPGIPTELIVVDNNSSDNTKDVVAGFEGSSFCKIKYLFESRQGHSQARNRGLAEARYPLVAFTDDDCYVAKDWMVSILREFSADPSLHILGGRVELADTGDQPVGIRTFTDRTQVLSFRELLSRMIGCNFVCARKVFDEVGGFDLYLGKGSRCGCAEDTDFFYRALKKGFKVIYVPEMIVFHAHGRSTSTAAHSVRDDYARGRGAFYCKYILKGDLMILKEALRELRGLVRTTLKQTKADYSRYPATRALWKLALGGLQRLSKR
ncbi:MAG: glycosyltransferase family 2 protein [Nitrospirales bacterium]